MILMVDDEPHRLGPWKRQLEAEMGALSPAPTIEVLGGADALLDRLRRDDRGPAVLILDVMMPPPTDPAFREDTVWGTRTGAVMLARIGDRWPSTRVLILSNIQDDRLRRDLGARHYPVHNKLDAGSPQALARAVRAVIAPPT